MPLLIKERRERRGEREECAGCVPRACYLPNPLSICLSAALPRGWALLLFHRPSCCACCLLPACYYHTYTETPLYSSLPIHHHHHHPLPPSALRADKVPRSHSTALAPCIGPARVNTAQSALDPDPLAFCSASRPLSAPPTDAPAIILIRLPQPPSHPIRIRRPTILFLAHRPPAAVALQYCSALPACPVAARQPALTPAQSYTSTSLPHHPLLFLLLPVSPHTILAVSR